MAPPQRPPVFLMSAMLLLMSSWYSTSTGSRHIFSPARCERAAEALPHGVVVGEDAGVDVTERDHAGAGEGGGVHQVGGAELAGVVEAVGEHQAAFGVGVDDLDGFAGHGDLHVAGLLRFAGGHVFARRKRRR